MLATRNVAAQQPVDDLMWQQYIHLLRGSTLEWDNAEPFLLKFEYQLYDLAGSASVKGAAEQSWGDANGKTVKIHSATLDVQEPQSDEATLRTHVRENYLAHQILGAITRPFPEAEQHKSFAMETSRRTVGITEMDCFVLGRADQRTSQTPVYCADAENRLAAILGQGNSVLERSNFRKYREHEVPMDISLSYGGKLAMTAHVTELDALPAQASHRPAKSIASATADRIPAKVLAGSILSKKTPDYPKLARLRHVTGTVLLWAIITKEGTVEALDVISSPDPQLSQAAVKAVQKWTYRPYLLNGEPTQVDTTISVNYELKH